jgi:hypothetical protein
MNSIANLVSARMFATRFFRLGTAALFACALLIPRVNAQDASGSKTRACVSPAMAQLLTPEGNSVRVSPTKQFSGQQAGSRENEKGIAAAQAQESLRTLQQAHDWFEKGARRGYAPAQVNLAVATLAGWGTPPNAGAAFYWLREAANQGYALAYYDLGILYLNGCGVHQDYREAFRFFEQGANAGDSAAQMNLGYLYDLGLGVAQDRARAADWYRKAAETGVAQAQYNLADLYLHGEGVPRDESLAFEWFKKAAIQGHAAARMMLGSMYAGGRGTAKDVSSAYSWLFAVALQGDNRAKALLDALEPQLTAADLAEAKSRARSLTQPGLRTPEVAVLR